MKLKSILTTTTLAISIVSHSQYCTPLSTVGAAAEEFINIFTTYDGYTRNITHGPNGSGSPLPLDPHYSDFRDLYVDARIGDTIPFDVQSGWINERIGMWIDWNQDGDFDDLDEYIAYFDLSNDLRNGEIVVPTHALIGVARMRIRSNRSILASWNPIVPSAGNSCADLYSGETEDYSFIVLQPSLPTKPSQTTSIEEVIDYKNMPYHYCNLMGQRISLDTKGLVLKVYENGHTEKIYIVQ